MRGDNFHAGGEADYQAAVEPLREKAVSRRQGRFHSLAARLCRHGGPLRGWVIWLAWGRVKERHCRRSRSAGDKSRALWLEA
jgi:hypothetical protein